jgi:hypothetical protein
MSLHLAKALHKALRQLREDLEADVRDWTALSLSPASAAHEATRAMLGEDRLNEAVRQFARYPGHNLNVLKILRRKRVDFFDPLSGKVVTATKSQVFRKYHFHFFTGPSGPGFVMCIGSRPQAIFYLTRKTWIDIRNHNDDHYAVLRQCLATVARLNRTFYRYLSEPAGVEVACIVGDERPTHFIRESLGGLQDYVDKGEITAFWDAIDYLIVPADNSFILTDELFEVPSHVKVIYAGMNDLNQIIAAKNLFTYRLMRSGSYMTDNLRERLTRYGDEASPALNWPEVAKVKDGDEYRTAWFGVEIEKGRLKNQREVFASFLAVLRDRFGDKVRLIIDGWSPSPIFLTKKDERIMASIRQFSREMMRETGIQFDVIEAFNMSYRDKIKLAGQIDFFVTMHGSAAIVPSLIRQKPGITYHSAWGMTIDHEVWTPTLYRTPSREQPSKLEVRHWAPFEVEIPAFRETLNRLIDDHDMAPKVVDERLIAANG